MSKEEDASAARDYVMARVLASRSTIAAVLVMVDELADLMVDPVDEDKRGAKRKSLLESVDASLTLAAGSIQQAMEAFPDIDPEEGEPEPEEDDEDEDAEEEEDEEDAEEGDEDKPRRRRRA